VAIDLKLQGVMQIGNVIYPNDSIPWVSASNFTVSLPNAIGAGYGTWLQTGNNYRDTVGHADIGAAPTS
jgi:hypothetical protein